MTEFLTDTTKLATGIAGVTLLALGIYSTREGVRVAGKTFDRWFGTPALVRHSSTFQQPTFTSWLVSSFWCTHEQDSH